MEGKTSFKVSFDSFFIYTFLGIFSLSLVYFLNTTELVMPYGFLLLLHSNSAKIDGSLEFQQIPMMLVHAS